ncbi:unnamed protein product [Brachionus calyciflorus]|uniref:Coiled-coil domain-containing protein n=1 Tax=Brachionus calyciflorus TaxID=104777 RepID=A0A813VXV3_9BILA|nr:unnamed protein product [Brachionus calyciflorus]
MPKNWGVNTKAQEAKARKQETQRAVTEKKIKEQEDKLWEDDDKHVQRKQQRKEEQEKKNLEKLQKKEESKKLLEEEMKNLKSAKPQRTETKMTQFEIEKIKEREAAAAAQAAAIALAAQKKIEIVEPELIENVNRIQIEGEVARNVDEAISILNESQTSVDLHPEKRMRAAYLEFEEENLERLKKEYSNMRLSQIKQILKKEWMKSPKNPMNKLLMSK